MRSEFQNILEILKEGIKLSAELFMEKACDVLYKTVDHYDWVGFYLTETKEEGMLVLGPFRGEPTEHTKIAFGQGICGQAAETGRPFIVQDVSKETNYLSCSSKVVSEIVIPIISDGEVLGEIDIDSHSLNPFTEDDRLFLEEIASLTASTLQG